MTKLYDKTGTKLLYDLSKDVVKCIVEEERNGLFELTLIYPATYQGANDLIKENIIIANANNVLLNQKFRIYNIRKAYSNMIEVCARHISYDLLGDFIENIDIENQSCEYALNTIFRNSQFSKHYKGYSDIVNAQNYKATMSNCLNAIVGQQGSIIDTYGTGAEILRDNENLHVLNRRGHDNNIVISYGDNLTGFDCEEDLTELITRIYPYTKRSDTEEVITLNEKFVDSPRINNYSHPYIKDIDLSDKFEQDEEITQAKLRLEAEKYFIKNNCDIPKMNFKVNFILLEKYNLSLCDVVTIKHKIYNIDTQSKVIRTVFDVMKNRFESMELGEHKSTLGDLIGSDSSEVKPGPPGPQGPPGADGNVGDFPDSLPDIPILAAKVIGFASVDLSWTFENKVYYSYQIFASKEENFNPNLFDLIFEGQASSHLHQVKPNETWYYRCRAVNSHGKATEFSMQVKVETQKVDDLSNYISEAAIDNALIGTLSLDRGWVGKLNCNYLDIKGNFSVTDGNGKRTFDIDSWGNVNLDVANFKIKSENVEEKLKSLADFKVNSENFQFDIENRGTANLIRNSNLGVDTSNWHKHEYMANGCYPNLNVVSPEISEWAYPDTEVNTLQLSDQNRWGLTQGEIGTRTYIKTVVGETYTLNFYCATHRANTAYTYVRGVYDNDYDFVAWDVFNPLQGGSDKNNWTYRTLTFTAQRSTTGIEFGIKDGSAEDPFLWIHKPMVNKGAIAAAYTTRANEIIKGVTTIDEEGLTVSHSSGSKASFKHNGSNWYNTNGTLGLKADYGGLMFYAPAVNEWSGFIKTSQNGNDSNQHGMSLSTTWEGYYVSLGCSQVRNAQDNWTVSSALSIESCDYNSSTNNQFRRAGLHLWSMSNENRNNSAVHNHTDYIQENGNIYMNGRAMYFDSFTEDYPNWVGRAGNDRGRLCMFGDNSVVIGVRKGSRSPGVIQIVEGDGGDSTDSWCNWNFNHWTMSNMRTAYDISNSRTRKYTESYGLKTDTSSTRYIYKNKIFNYNSKEDTFLLTLSIPLEYQFSNYTILNITKYGRGDVWIREENETYFILEAANGISVNVEIDIEDNPELINSYNMKNNRSMDNNPPAKPTEYEHFTTVTETGIKPYWQLYQDRDRLPILH